MSHELKENNTEPTPSSVVATGVRADMLNRVQWTEDCEGETQIIQLAVKTLCTESNLSHQQILDELTMLHKYQVATTYFDIGDIWALPESLENTPRIEKFQRLIIDTLKEHPEDKKQFDNKEFEKTEGIKKIVSSLFKSIMENNNNRNIIGDKELLLKSLFRLVSELNIFKDNILKEYSYTLKTDDLSSFTSNEIKELQAFFAQSFTGYIGLTLRDVESIASGVEDKFNETE
jgi:hypothetical protein